jgi:cytochrome c-type biogenesis protein CcmF
MNAMGELSLALAILAAVAALTASLAAGRFDSPGYLRLARWSLAAVAAAFVAASAVLLMALIGGDFQLVYVASFTDRALPLGYKLAAFWAGQEGSLLLWAVLLAIMSALAAFTIRSQSLVQAAATIGTLALVCTFFGFLLLLAADPFTISGAVPADGNGLNPMLRDPAMIAHPPLLFLGYAGFTVPFALMVGALVAGRRDESWIGPARIWTLIAWLGLTAGILLGARWAYVELGWGGYWAWDPVENASLLPWLTGIACFHSLIVQRQRGMLRIWSAWLLLGTFILCLFGTYITRSGIVDSVHGFGQSLTGTLFLAMIIAVTLAGSALLIWRRRLLRSAHELSGLIGREGGFLAGNILLAAMAVVVLLGTMFPVLSGWLSGTRTTLDAHFYDHVAAPIGLVVAALMATGPLLTYGEKAARKFAAGIAAPAALALIAAAAVYFHGIHNPWALACAAIAAGAITTIIMDAARHPHSLVTNHRRSGAQVAHLGLILAIVGITGSSVFSVKQNDQLNPGDTITFSGMKLKLDSLAEDHFADYTAVTAAISVTSPDGSVIMLHPKRRFFQNWDEQPNSVVAIDSTWNRDLYLTLAGWDANGKNVAIQAILNPLVCWIWIGGCVLLAGGIICLIPRFEPARVAAAAPMPAAKRRMAVRKTQLGRSS